MLNICEPLYKHRHPQQVKGDDRLDPKWEMAWDVARRSASADTAPSANRRELNDPLEQMRNVESRIVPLRRGRHRKAVVQGAGI